MKNIQKQKQRSFQCLCWKPIAPDPFYHQSKGHLQIQASAQRGGHEPQGWSLQSCSALQPTAEQNLIVRQAASCRKPGWGALCSALLASSWRATGGSSTRARPSRARLGQSTPQSQAGAARLPPPECRQRLCLSLSTLRVKPPSELLPFREGARAVPPASSPVGWQAAHRRDNALWDTWSTSHLQPQKEDSTSGTRPSSQG